MKNDGDKTNGLPEGSVYAAVPLQTTGPAGYGHLKGVPGQPDVLPQTLPHAYTTAASAAPNTAATLPGQQPANKPQGVLPLALAAGIGGVVLLGTGVVAGAFSFILMVFMLHHEHIILITLLHIVSLPVCLVGCVLQFIAAARMHRHNVLRFARASCVCLCLYSLVCGITGGIYLLGVPRLLGTESDILFIFLLLLAALVCTLSICVCVRLARQYRQKM